MDELHVSHEYHVVRGAKVWIYKTVPLLKALASLQVLLLEYSVVSHSCILYRTTS